MNDDLPTKAMLQAGAIALVQCGIMNAGETAEATADSVWRAMEEARAAPAEPEPAAPSTAPDNVCKVENCTWYNTVSIGIVVSSEPTKPAAADVPVVAMDMTPITYTQAEVTRMLAELSFSANGHGLEVVSTVTGPHTSSLGLRRVTNDQPAPAADAVPVVAHLYEDSHGDRYLHLGVNASWAIPAQPLVKYFDHAAAMEAMQAKLDDAERALEKRREQDHAAAVRFGAHMQAMEALRQENERLNAELGERTDTPQDFAAWAADNVMSLQHDGYTAADVEHMLDSHLRACWDAAIASVRADRSAQVAEVMRLVAAYGARVQRDSLKPSVYPSDDDVPDYTEFEAVQAAVSKLAGEAL